MEGSTLTTRSRQPARAGTKRITLSELAASLQHGDARGTVAQLLSRTAEAVGARCCAWYFEQQGKLRLGDTAGPKSSVVPRELDLREGYAEWNNALHQGKPVHCAKSELPRNQRRLHLDLDCNYLALLPLQQADRYCGALVVCFDRSETLGKSELELLRGAAALLLAATARLTESQRLREAQAKLRTILRSSAEYAILTTTEDFDIVEQNATAIELFGRDGSGESVVALVKSSTLTPRSFGKIRKEVQRRGKWESELEAAPQDGTAGKNYYHFVITALRDEDGEAPGGYLIFARDVTETRQRERKLLDSQRMESVGLLAGGIAHDFNNILMGILGYASLAQDLVGSEHPAQRMLSTIEQSAERAASLTAQLMAYCRGGKLTTAPIDVDNLLDETHKLLGSSLPPQVSVTRATRGTASNVLGDPTQLQQVFMNLCLNAAEAITERINQQPAGKGTGEIAITVRDTQLRNQFEVFGANNEPLSGKFVLVQVKDDGTGMDETTLRRIFEPFFTTKFTGRGLGLAAVIGIIQNHGGGLRVTSKPGQGSTFSVYLPATRSYATPIEEQAPPLSLEGSETVLIIDDEAVARQLGLLTLANLGYQVLLAASGEEGLETYRQYQGQIGLVILDLTMQGLGGEEVLAELAMMDQPVPVLLTSGYDENMAGERAGSRYTTGFLQKPYTPEVLAKAVREVLDKSK